MPLKGQRCTKPPRAPRTQSELAEKKRRLRLAHRRYHEKHRDELLTRHREYDRREEVKKARRLRRHERTAQASGPAKAAVPTLPPADQGLDTWRKKKQSCEEWTVSNKNLVG